MNELLDKFLYLVLLTLMPALELRLSIPVGLWNKPIQLPFLGTVNGFGLSFWEVVPLVVATNIFLGVILYVFLDRLVKFFTRISFIERIYSKIVERTQRRVKKYVEKFGAIGLALFIGIPLPGSGVWTGALAAYLFGLDFKKFVLADIAGVTIAAAVVTAVSLGAFNLL